MKNGNPTVLQMVREAIEKLGGNTTNGAIVKWIQQHYPGTNKNTIQCTILSSCVNVESRINWPENSKPRACNSQYDFLYKPGRGLVELYDPERHGQWELRKNEDGEVVVNKITTTDIAGIEPETYIAPESTKEKEQSGETTFAAEAHLRDYLARNLRLIEPGLELYVDENEINGVEYRTPIGTIDILAIDSDQQFVVIELKVSRGNDPTAGQILRYKNWVRKHMADNGPVRGIIIAQYVSDKLRYAIASDPEVSAKEYELNLKFNDVDCI